MLKRELKRAGSIVLDPILSPYSLGLVLARVEYSLTVRNVQRAGYLD